jgi:hypothetical protein
MRLLVLFAATIAAASPCAQQSFFATRVVAFDDRGKAGGGLFDPLQALGRPQGLLHVHSLGIGGHLTLGFDQTIADGPGADLIVTENPFFAGPLGQAFSEALFVEVSSNGTDFARVPCAYHGPDQSPGPYATVPVGWYSGFGGVMPSDPFAADLQDVVLAGGDAIDLADLRAHPLVVQGKVRLDRIAQVRLVDAVDSVDRDSSGARIHDPGNGSADVDAVTILHATGRVDPRGPRVELAIPASGDFRVTIEDPDGLGDLDPASFRAAFWGLRVPGLDLLGWMQLVELTPTRCTLQLGTALPGGLPLHVAVAIRDRAGNRSGAARTRPLR